MRKLYILVFLALISFGCRRNIEAGIKTNVTGVVFDNWAQQPIPDVPILVQEYEQGMYGPIPKRVIDSTRSGNDGKFAITFTSTGQGTQYRIGFRPNSNFYTIQDAITVPVGKDTSIEFWATKLSTLKAEIQMVNNPNPPMRVATIPGFGVSIDGISKDTTVFLKVIPNTDNVIRFNITNIDTPAIYNIRLDTVKLQGFQDTFTKAFQVDPRFFNKRG